MSEQSPDTTNDLCTCPECLLARKHPKVMRAYSAFAQALNADGVPHTEIHFTAIAIASAWLFLLRNPDCTDELMDSHVMAAVNTGRQELAPMIQAALIARNASRGNVH